MGYLYRDPTSVMSLNWHHFSPAAEGGGDIVPHTGLPDRDSHATVAARRRPGPQRLIPAPRLVAAIDVALVLATFFSVVVGVNLDHMPHGLEQFLAVRVTVKSVLLVACLIAGVLLVFRRARLYDAHSVRRRRDEARRVLLATSAVTVMATIVPLTSRSGAVDGWSLLVFWGASSAALMIARGTRAKLAGNVERRRVIVVGTGRHAIAAFRELCADVFQRYAVVGFVDTNATTGSPFVERRTLGRLEQLEELLVGEQIDEVYVGLPVKSHYRQIQDTIRTCERLGIKVTYGAHIFDTEIAKPRVHAARDTAPRVQLESVPWGARLLVKRTVDLVGALAVLIVVSPLMLAAALAIKLTSKGPVIFSQERCGLNRRRFRMHKFRTMVHGAEQLQASLESRNEADGPVFKIVDDPRITRVGRFLRRTSIDELPQLFNVLGGDMSLVGPRPLPLRDVGRFRRTRDWRRFSVRPGLTCLWQVQGRNAIGFDEWVALDLQYIDQWSLRLDLLILARTVPAVLRGTGAS
ncbi:MAG: sugar transferase [Vicinamibacteraceae bacterium]